VNGGEIRRLPEQQLFKMFKEKCNANATVILAHL
jgi:hypothetical protein